MLRSVVDLVELERVCGAGEDGPLLVLVDVGPLKRHVAELVVGDLETVGRGLEVAPRDCEEGGHRVTAVAPEVRFLEEDILREGSRGSRSRRSGSASSVVGSGCSASTMIFLPNCRGRNFRSP